MSDHAPCRRRTWLQFSVRALCLLVIVAAIAFALLGERIRSAERQRYVIGEVQRLGGDVYYEDERIENGYSRTLSREVVSLRRALRDRVNDSYFRTVSFISISSDDVSETLIDEIGKLPQLRELNVTPPVRRSAALQRLVRLRPTLEVIVQWSPRHVPFEEMKSPAALRQAIQKGSALRFTDGFWSIDCAAARPRLAAFREAWVQDKNALKISWLRIDLSSSPDSPMPDAFRQWLGEMGVDTGGMKQMGAGRIIWFQNGAIRDVMWCRDLGDVGDLKLRTQKAFE